MRFKSNFFQRKKKMTERKVVSFLDLFTIVIYIIYINLSSLIEL